jgi:hypothetical protein
MFRVTSLMAVVGFVLVAAPWTAQGQDAPAGGGVAQDTTQASPTPAPTPVQTPAQTPPQKPAPASVPASVQSSPATNEEFTAKSWTPRPRTGEINLHGGGFVPNHASATSPTLGIRMSLDLGSHVLLGILGDWSFNAKSLLAPVANALPGFEPNIVLAKVDAQLIPAMAFLQVKLTDKLPVVPYAGVGAGYEWLILNVHDYRTSQEAHATYENWAWQSFAGMGMRLSKGVRLDTEVFYNGGVLGRDVTDVNGVTWRETVDCNGVGLRAGLNFVY